MSEETTSTETPEPISADQAVALTQEIDRLREENKQLRQPQLISQDEQVRIWGTQMLEGLERGGR